MRRMSWAAIGLFALVVVVGCNGANSKAVQGGERPSRFARPTPVKVERRDIVEYVLLQGRTYLPPTAMAVLYPPYHAPVERVFKKPGDSVSRGEPIMNLSLPEAEAAYKDSKTTVEQAQAAYDAAKAQYEGPVRQAKAQLDEARATERTFRQQASASGDGTELQQAEQQRLAAEQTLRQTEAEFKSNMLTYQHQLDEAKRAAQRNKSVVREGAVRSPIAGTVMSVAVRAGQDIGQDAKQALAQIADLGSIQVKATVAPEQEKQVKPHSPVVLTFAGLEEHPIDGRVTSLRSLPGPNGEARLEATIDFKNEKGLVKPGIEIERIGVRLGETRNALAIPVEAVVKDDSGKSYVKKMTGSDRWVKQAISTGASDGSYIAVKSGLKLGDTVLAPAG